MMMVVLMVTMTMRIVVGGGAAAAAVDEDINVVDLQCASFINSSARNAQYMNIQHWKDNII